jgi:outer membrane protein OmpA-like peptidoglycan-associated protein
MASNRGRVALLAFAAAALVLATGSQAADLAQVTPSSSLPAGTNIAALDFGGEVESVTGSFGPGHGGRLLIDGLTEPAWKPDVDGEFPLEIVLSFYEHEAALVSAVAFSFPAEVPSRPKDIEIAASTSGPTDGFTSIAKATLDPDSAVLTVSFPPVQARYLKIRLLSGTEFVQLQIGEIAVIEGAAKDYVSLLARHPEIKRWKSSVRFAAQKGIDWLEPATIDWQSDHSCFGCHVQGQTLMGLAVAKANAYVVSDSFMNEVAKFTRAHQRDDGTVDFPDASASPTQYMALGLVYFDQAAGQISDPALLKATNWLLAHQQPSGAIEGDWDEPPISQGSFMPTANAAVAFKSAFENSKDTRYAKAADRALAYLAQGTPETTQDEVFQILALSQFGSAEQRQLIPQFVQILLSQQDRDGGWRENKQQAGANALATGEVLYAVKQAGVSVASPEFTAGVRYLLKMQEPPGTWPSANSQSRRPSEFAPTMWAVIGLAGSYGDVAEPTAASIKSELDTRGRAILYINFDFDKSTIRPDAKPVIAQVIKLMNDNPSLALKINGHTDGIGLHDYNVKLSKSRAAAVVAALVAAQIAPGRLSSGGFGPDQPIADNATDHGRAKNRRVELVKM